MQRPSSVYNWYTEEGGPYVSRNSEGTRRRQPTDSIWNTSFSYGSQIGGPSFLYTLWLLDVLAICFSRGQVVSRNGVDISGCGIL